jgi:hypothetical protein
MMKRYNFHPFQLQEILLGLSLAEFESCLPSNFTPLEHNMHVDFSQVKYYEVAAIVGLDPYQDLMDANTFELHRSYIPAAVFTSVVKEMAMVPVNGPSLRHGTEKATSQYLTHVRTSQFTILYHIY